MPICLKRDEPVTVDGLTVTPVCGKPRDHDGGHDFARSATEKLLTDPARRARLEESLAWAHDPNRKRDHGLTASELIAKYGAKERT